MTAVQLTGRTLTLADVVEVARRGGAVELGPEATEAMQAARSVVEDAVERGEGVYGLTTGVGMRKRFAIEEEQRRFNRMLIAGHLIAQGDAAPEDVARATMVVVANGLASGAAGARPELVQLVVDALNDRCEAAHPDSRLGRAGRPRRERRSRDTSCSESSSWRRARRSRSSTATPSRPASAALAVADYATLLDALDSAGALDLEAFAANTSPLDPAVADARPHPGLTTTLERLRELLDGSSLWSDEPRNLQDPLSFRTIPQVHGAARDALRYAESVLAVELNSHQGNPLVVSDGGRIVSVGNFDVVPLAAALDFLRIALAPALTSAAERALKLLQAPFSGLPEGLAAKPGLAEPGLSELGAAVQAFAAEARLLAQPVSFELVSTTQHEGIEDRTTMAPLAARRLARDGRAGRARRGRRAHDRSSGDRPPTAEGARRGTARTRSSAYVELVPFTAAGEPLPPDLQPVVDLVRSGSLGA